MTFSALFASLPERLQKNVNYQPNSGRVENFCPLPAHRLLTRFASAHSPTRATRPPRLALFLSQTCTSCHGFWKLMQRVSSLVATFISKTTEGLAKHCKVKMWNLLVNLQRFFSCLRAALRVGCVIHSRTLKICSFTIHTPSHPICGPATTREGHDTLN